MEENKQDMTLADETTPEATATRAVAEVTDEKPEGTTTPADKMDEIAPAKDAENTVDMVDSAAGKTKRARKRVVMIVAAICVVLLVAAGVGGWLAWSRHELDMAKAECDSAAATVKSVKTEYAKLVSGDAKAASEITVEQVKDGTAVETLAKALKVSEPKSVTCPVKNTKSVKAATVKLNTQADWYKAHKASLSKAVKNVNQSKLDKIIDTANTLLADSDGKVADNATRDELSKAIEAKDEQAINEATAKVNDSIAAKTKADEEEARAKAEAEAAAAQAAAAAQQSYSNYSSSSGSSSSSSANSSSSKPVLSGGHGVDPSSGVPFENGIIVH